MSHNHTPRGVFVLSVDVPHTSTSAAASDQLARLVRQVRAHHVAATWSVSLGANLVQFADLLGQATSHQTAGGELAWRAEPAWAEAKAGRGKFAVALAERQAAALEAGVEISTLILPEGCRPVHLDVAAKYGVRSLISVGNEKTSRSVQPHALRFGVWSVPIATTIAAASSWWTNQARRAVQQINHAARNGTACHVHADLSRPEVVAVLEKVLAHVQRCRVEGRLAVETVGQLTARLTRPRVAIRPARSILRAA